MISSEPENLFKRNYTVGITRVVSMFMIIGCHVFSWLGINSLAMILNVGVYTFLIISFILRRYDKASEKAIVDGKVYFHNQSMLIPSEQNVSSLKARYTYASE